MASHIRGRPFGFDVNCWQGYFLRQRLVIVATRDRERWQAGVCMCENIEVKALNCEEEGDSKRLSYEFMGNGMWRLLKTDDTMVCGSPHWVEGMRCAAGWTDDDGGKVTEMVDKRRELCQ